MANTPMRKLDSQCLALSFLLIIFILTRDGAQPQGFENAHLQDGGVDDHAEYIQWEGV